MGLAHINCKVKRCQYWIGPTCYCDRNALLTPNFKSVPFLDWHHLASSFVTSVCKPSKLLLESCTSARVCIPGLCI